MNASIYKWLWQSPEWPNFQWQDHTILPLLRSVRLQLGVLLGKAGAVTKNDNLEAALDALLNNIVTSSAIEGERLNAQSVRSSLAKRLGVDAEEPYPTSERSEGLANMMFDAINNLDDELSTERLQRWHQWLFPEADFSMSRIRVGQFRGEEPMQVVSGRIDKPKVHFEAPPRCILDAEITKFVSWFNHSRLDPVVDPLLRAAICHFWFITIHPFEDGNGRITRALTDLALAQADSQSIRLYAMSAGTLENSKEYYHILEKCQRGSIDLTPWLEWFLITLEKTLRISLASIDRTLVKTRFWRYFNSSALSVEQVKVLNRLLDGGETGFEQGISASQYQKVAKVSKATATRHLADLLNKGCLEKLPGGGRNTRYQIRFFD